MLVFVGISVFLLLLLAQYEWKSQLNSLLSDNQKDNLKKPEPKKFYLKWWTALLATFVGCGLIALIGDYNPPLNIKADLLSGELVEADYWSKEPLILSAGMGFDNIVGVPKLTEEEVKKAGGTWHGTLVCKDGSEPNPAQRTTAVTNDFMRIFADGEIKYDDGLPVVFSWPVATETIDVTDFQFTLNNGDKIFANAITMVPNWELNERNVVVLFGQFGNRLSSSDPKAVFPVKLEIVKDETPLLLIGPEGREFNAVGLTWTTNNTPYDSDQNWLGQK